MRLRTKIIIPLIIGATFLFIVSPPGVWLLFTISNATAEPIPTYEEIPDNVILNRTRDMPEVIAFMKEYPESYVIVDRASGFKVSYYMRECPRENEGCIDDPSVVEPYVALHVRLDSKGFPKSTYVYCVNDIDDYKIEQDVLEYIRNKSCF